MAELRSRVPRSVLRDGVHAGVLFGSDKASMDAAGEALVAAAGYHKNYAEAAGAALAALAL